MKFASNSLTVLEDGSETDIMPQELKAIEEYKEKGLPGVASISDVTLTKSLDLYMTGKTYHEISQTLGTRKEIVLYYAQKFNWYATKMEHMELLDATIKQRILHANLVNQDFLLQIQHFFNKKIGNKMTRYMSTGDDEMAAKVSLKDIDTYFKAVDLLNKISTERVPLDSRNKSPVVGLNMGDHGVNIRKVGENEVVITPRNKTVGEMLKDLADKKREEEASDKKSNDIKEKVTDNTEGKEE